MSHEQCLVSSKPLSGTELRPQLLGCSDVQPPFLKKFWGLSPPTRARPPEASWTSSRSTCSARMCRGRSSCDITAVDSTRTFCSVFGWRPGAARKFFDCDQHRMKPSQKQHSAACGANPNTSKRVSQILLYVWFCGFLLQKLAGTSTILLYSHQTKPPDLLQNETAWTLWNPYLSSLLVYDSENTCIPGHYDTLTLLMMIAAICCQSSTQKEEFRCCREASASSASSVSFSSGPPENSASASASCVQKGPSSKNHCKGCFSTSESGTSRMN